MHSTSVAPSRPVTRTSIADAAFAVIERGGSSWYVGLFDFVDDFRETRDARLIETPPTKALEPRLYAIFACTVEALCHELGIATPAWVLDTEPLKEPWFVSGIENLKAMALVESPAYFRRRNVFVLGNFLDRA